MTTETYVNADGHLIDTEVLPDAMRELQVAEVVSLSPVVVQVGDRRRTLHKRLESIDVANVTVGTRLLVCRVEQGVIAVGVVI